MYRSISPHLVKLRINVVQNEKIPVIFLEKLLQWFRKGAKYDLEEAVRKQGYHHRRSRSIVLFLQRMRVCLEAVSAREIEGKRERIER